MDTLAGRRVALLEGRMPVEMAKLVTRRGGLPYAVPAVRVAPRDESRQVARLIERLDGDDIDQIVFLTGAGVQAPWSEAERLGQCPALLHGLQTATTVCRGPKPAAALARLGVPARIRAAAPFTTTEVIAALEAQDIAGRAVVLVHYGERDQRLAELLRGRGARLDELCLYEWRLPEDIAPLQSLVGEIIAGRIDAVAFTSQVQVRHLFNVATQMGRTAELTNALNRKSVVASLAPTCLAALRAVAVEPHVVPEYSKSGHLIEALAHFFNTPPDERRRLGPVLAGA